MPDETRITRSQMYLPLLEALQEAGGSASPARTYDAMAEKLGVTDEQRARQARPGRGQQFNLFERTTRWVRQTAVLRGDVDGRARGVWTLTDAGAGRLANAAPGVVVTIYETGLSAAMWATMEAALGVIDDGSLDLVFSSPPYPCANKGYENGALDEASWVSFMFDVISALGPKMAATGSMMWNVAETYQPGLPIKAEHLSRLRVRLADESRFRVLDSIFWQNSSRLPTPVTWVSQRRIRLKPSVESLIWLSDKDPGSVKADNRRILEPYGRFMRERLAGRRENPSPGRHSGGAYVSKGGFATDNGGSIASTLVTAGASGGNRNYYAGTRADGLPLHPAMMPARLADRMVRFCTAPGDLVYDPFGGSGTTAEVCEKLGRRWLTSDISLAYGLGSRHRFPDRSENGELVRRGLQACGAPS